MTVYETDTYKLLYEQLEQSKTELAEWKDKLEAELANLAHDQNTVNSWKQKLPDPYAYTRMNETQAVIDNKWLPNVAEAENQVAKWTESVAKNTAALDTYEDNYTKSVRDGVDPKNAEELAKKESDAILADYTPYYIAGGIVVAAVIIFFVIRAIRKK